MEMKKVNSSWENKTTVKKGNYAEDIVTKYLEDKNFIVYEPVTNGAHGFDKLAVRNKQQFVIAECKAKAKRKYYNDTGIDIRHYKEYKLAQEKHNIPVFIFFIDEYLGEIYGNFLSELEKPFENYPLEHKGIIYFPLNLMRRNISNLTPKEIEFLKSHSTRNYNY